MDGQPHDFKIQVAGYEEKREILLGNGHLQRVERRVRNPVFVATLTCESLLEEALEQVADDRLVLVLVVGLVVRVEGTVFAAEGVQFVLGFMLHAVQVFIQEPK